MQRLAGIVIIGGFVVFVVSMLLSPPRLYQEKDKDVRLGIIEKYKSRWTTAQTLGAAAPVVTAVSFLFLTFALQGKHSPWLINLVAGIVIVR